MFINRKLVLGLDLGVGSIGWCLVSKDLQDNPLEIVAIGSRVVPLSTTEINDFKVGKSKSPSQQKRLVKSFRRNIDRYQMRRYKLVSILKYLNMMPNVELMKAPLIELWSLRSRAATVGEKLSLEEIGRVLFHINQKRGPQFRIDDESTDTVYKEAVNHRHKVIRESKQTVGQYFYCKLQNSRITNPKGKSFYTYRIKDNVLPREAYEEEFMQIMDVQMKFYPEVLTPSIISRLFDTIFFQRELKSCKKLVSVCDIEKREYPIPDKEGQYRIVGPKVAPKSSPLFQVFKIWQSISNISFTDIDGQRLYIKKDVRNKLFNHILTKGKLNARDCYNIVGVSDKEFSLDKLTLDGIKGNLTLNQISKALSLLPVTKRNELLEFDLKVEEQVDTVTGEIHNVISNDMLSEPLYKLWHTLYSLNKADERRKCLQNNFGISDEQTIDELCKLNFKKDGYCKLSSKAIRRILPYLQEGYDYAQSCLLAGFRHSDYVTTEENEGRPLQTHLPILKKNELHQPVVEKVLNQMIGIVNRLIEKYGEIDETRIELARELQRSKKEREDMDKQNRENLKRNEEIAEKLKKENGINKPTHRMLMKYRQFEETGGKCMYCGGDIDLKTFMYGIDTEWEHIIPKALLFDNSFSNSICACQKCNKTKNDKTAYDYMRSLGTQRFNDYKGRVKKMYDEKSISRTKYKNLLASFEDYQERKRNGCATEEDKELWENYIDRQIRQTQYISRAALKMLKNVCRNVYASSGTVTSFLRHGWGYDNILHDLNLPVYDAAGIGLTEDVVVKQDGKDIQVHRIKGWNKRMDNRHHAIDALVVACTKQSIVQRLNEFNSSRTEFEEEVKSGKKKRFKNKKSMLEKWVEINTPFSKKEVAEKVSGIIVSYRTSNKVASSSTNRYLSNGKTIVEKGIISPRLPLHESHLYGKINGKNVYRYSLSELFLKKKDVNIEDVLKSIVDKGIVAILENRINAGIINNDSSKKPYDVDPAKAKENLATLVSKPPMHSNGTPIRRVKCYVSKPTIPVRTDSHGTVTAYAVSGNNHHIEFYRNDKGEFKESVISYWQAFLRIKNHLTLFVNIDNASILRKASEEGFDIGEIHDSSWDPFLCLGKTELVVIGLKKRTIENLIKRGDYSKIASHVYKVCGVSQGDYTFCIHNEIKDVPKERNKPDGRFIRIQNIKSLANLELVKVKINPIGEITIL